MDKTLGLGKKKLRHRNRYRNLILVSVADTETRFWSYTTLGCISFDLSREYFILTLKLTFEANNGAIPTPSVVNWCISTSSLKMNSLGTSTLLKRDISRITLFAVLNFPTAQDHLTLSGSLNKYKNSTRKGTPIAS